MGDSAQSTFRTGDVVNRKWVILELVGRGGMGEVYKAYQVNLQRDVAIKVISRKMIEDVGDDEEEAAACLERFRREVQVMAQVRHPNVLRVFDYGSASVKKDDEEVQVEYIVMEFMPGPTLRTTMSAEGFHPDEERTREWIVQYFLPVLDGVCALHDLGIIHRDLKPENILFDGAVPKILDFGLARSSRLGPLTQSVDIKGTPAYMSPEHFMDFRRTDERADVYSLGKILYEATAGKIDSSILPFKQAGLKDPEGLFFKALDKIIRNATIEHKHERYQTVRDLKSAIVDVIGPLPKHGILRSPVPKRTLGTVSVLVAVAAIAGSAVFATKYYARTPATDHHPNPQSETEPLSQRTAKNGAGPAILPSTLMGLDNATLHLVPGGEMPAGTQSGAISREDAVVEPFYMDETLVTNHQFVEFLNLSLSKISVKDNVVRGDGHAWLLLGEVVRGYEPIAYRNGRFEINGAQHSSCPVLRVTAYGASAYADCYGKRLPSRKEWAYAVYSGNASGESSNRGLGERTGQEGNRAMAPDSNMPSPVLDAAPDRLGIRGLNGKIAEWAVSAHGSRDQSFLILGGAANTGKDRDLAESGIRREPWEAFEMVGFRTVLKSQGGATPSK